MQPSIRKNQYMARKIKINWEQLLKNIGDNGQTHNSNYILSAYREAGYAVAGIALSKRPWAATIKLYPNLTSRVVFHRDNYRLGKLNKGVLSLAREMAGCVARLFHTDAEKEANDIITNGVMPVDLFDNNLNNFLALHDSYKSRAVLASLDTLNKHWNIVERIARVFLEKGAGTVRVPCRFLRNHHSELEHEPFNNSHQKAA